MSQQIALSICIPMDYKGMRLDQALARCLPEHSRTRLVQWMKEGHIDKAKQGLSNLVKLFYTRFSKGIEDPEQHLEGNFGFLGTEAIQIDIGHIRKQQPLDKAVEKEKIWRLLAPLKKQLESNYPELDRHLETAFQTVWN